MSNITNQRSTLKGLYVKMLEITYNPFGIKENTFKFSYKHTFSR
jgi:hypothetical protein